MRILWFLLIFGVLLCAQTMPVWAKKTQLNQIDEIVFSPSKVLKAGDLLALSTPFIGRRLSSPDIEQLIDSINKIYQSQGYLLSHAKLDRSFKHRQKIRILLIEKDISADLTGLPPAATRILKGQVLNQPFNLLNLQKSMILLNEISGLEANSQLIPASESGDYMLKIVPKQDWYSGFYQFDNITNDPKRSWRALSEVRIHTNLPYLEVLGVRGAQITGDDSADYAEIFTETWFGINGLRLNNRYAKLSSETPSADLGFIAAGNAELFETTLVSPLQRDFSKQSDLILSLKNIKNQSLISDLAFVDESITSINLGYKGQSNLVNRAEFYEVNIVQGIDLFNKNNNSARSRPDADGRFTALNAQYQTVFRPKTSIISYNISAKAQFSFDNLPASDEFSIGGNEFGKGYGFAAVSGDDGFAINLEMVSPTLRTMGGQFSGNLYGFIDAGMAHEKKSNETDESFEIISSSGVGLRTKILDHNFNIEFAAPLYETNLKENSFEHSPRLTFKLSGEF